MNKDHGLVFRSFIYLFDQLGNNPLGAMQPELRHNSLYGLRISLYLWLPNVNVKRVFGSGLPGSLIRRLAALLSTVHFANMKYFVASLA